MPPVAPDSVREMVESLQGAGGALPPSPHPATVIPTAAAQDRIAARYLLIRVFLIRYQHVLPERN